MTFDRKQVGVLAGMATAALVCVVVLAAGFRLNPFDVPIMPDFLDRLRYVLRADIFVLFWLVATVANIARARFFSPADIDGSGLTKASDRMAVRIAILQNTLEQTVLAIGSHVSLAAAAGPRAMLWIPPLVVLFCLGRLAFWIGYAGGAGRRAFGFGTTFYPTVFAYVSAAIAVIC